MTIIKKMLLSTMALALSALLWAQELDQATLDLWLGSYDVMLPFDDAIDESQLIENNVQTLEQYLDLIETLGLYADMETAVVGAGWQSLAQFFQLSEQISEGIMAVIEEEMMADFPPEFRELVADSQFAHVSEQRRELIRLNMDTIFNTMESQRFYEESPAEETPAE